jgi:hypothetical protein
MSENSLWYGYLEAGAKSTAVLRDPKLDTGNPATMYLFNLARREILEYRRDIVEGKLRELGKDEAGLAAQLKAQYGEARRTFKARARPALAPERPPVVPRKRLEGSGTSEEEDLDAAEEEEEES